jgi:PleD family two-component response regulator
MKHGASDYLPKPFTPEVLTRRVSRTIKLSALGKQLAPVKGMLLGSAISAILWALTLLALTGLFY